MPENDVSKGPLVSVVTVTFNSADHIRGCLESVARTSRSMCVEHIVIDNASRDDTASIVQSEFPHTVFVRNGGESMACARIPSRSGVLS